jgi:Leucine-rich repeat (LRR) protein
LERIDLSGFKNKRFSRSGLRELIDGIQNLPCIRTLVLRENGINEDCEGEILEIFTITNIKCIDLSKNAIGPRLAAQIGKKLKDEVQHI